MNFFTSVTIPGILCLFAGETLSAQNIRSTFDHDVDGWVAYENRGSRSSPQTPQHVSCGTECGYIQIGDLGAGSVVFGAPAKFLGDLTWAHGGTLRFELSNLGSAPIVSGGDDVILINRSGDTLTTSLPLAEIGSTWSSHLLFLDTATAWYLNGSSMPATDAEIRTVMGDLRDLLIKGEYRNGTDTGRLDNVVLSGKSIADDFERGPGGWEVLPRGVDSNGVPVLPAQAARHDPSIGNPGGCLYQPDDWQTGTFYFSAPGRYLNDLTHAAGGTLSFERSNSSSGTYTSRDEVILVGQSNGVPTLLRLGNLGNVSSNGWTSETVRLDTTGGFEVNGAPATMGQIQDVLGSLQMLLIKGDHYNGRDTGYLDNVAVRPCTPIEFHVTPKIAEAGDTLVLTTFYGTPGQLAGVMIVGINGVPFFFPLPILPYGQDCKATFALPVPSVPHPIEVAFKAFGVNRCGTFDPNGSNPQVVVIH